MDVHKCTDRQTEQSTHNRQRQTCIRRHHIHTVPRAVSCTDEALAFRSCAANKSKLRQRLTAFQGARDGEREGEKEGRKKKGAREGERSM